ncbi:hypothetical protein B0J13DRAFT_644073 [Dactylonectria estremocensis]|uniref:Uncharacterized protein n=1 Tax=Dactylonectria estremocensis TaxID=1079267 RepID=A0A9P9JCL5_9HYPO|nr:hypothetical protein B0J13DRAFT_644073 [Dactylonectria estremocensis]
MNWESENKSYREIWKASASEASLVEFFMTSSENMNRLAPEVKAVVSFCPEEILEGLESACPLATMRNVSLLDDRTNDDRDTPSESRGYLGPLTAHKLYLELKKRARATIERFRCQKHDTQTGSDGAQLYLPDADRRLIFITDLSPWAMMAIMATASIHQVKTLREIFYRHLTFESFIGTQSPNSYEYSLMDFQTFSKHFGWLLIYHSGSLRNVTDLSFLTRQMTGSALDFLCEAKVSVLITGSDPCRWVAYCFVNTYFDQENSEDSVDAYHEVREFGEDSIQLDPLTAGHLDANLPIKGPREYFLAVLQARLRLIKAEWHVLVKRLETLVLEYIETCAILTTHQPTSGYNYIPTVRECNAWALRTMKLLQQLAQTLKTTIKQFESFEVDATFATVTAHASTSCIPAISTMVEDLRRYLQNLELLIETCNCYAKELSLHSRYAGVHDAKAQTKMAANGQKMAFIMFFVTPIALAASVLSMQPQVLPDSIKLNGASFFILVILFMILMSSAGGVLLNWGRIKHYMKRDLRLKSSERDLELQEL